LEPSRNYLKLKIFRGRPAPTLKPRLRVKLE
jgi:hypothetical protein